MANNKQQDSRKSGSSNRSQTSSQGRSSQQPMADRSQRSGNTSNPPRRERER